MSRGGSLVGAETFLAALEALWLRFLPDTASPVETGPIAGAGTAAPAGSSCFAGWAAGAEGAADIAPGSTQLQTLCCDWLALLLQLLGASTSLAAVCHASLHSECHTAESAGCLDEHAVQRVLMTVAYQTAVLSWPSLAFAACSMDPQHLQSIHCSTTSKNCSCGYCCHSFLPQCAHLPVCCLTFLIFLFMLSAGPQA